MNEFKDKCEKGDYTSSANLTYPKTLRVEEGVGRSYQVQIDLAKSGLPSEETIDLDSADARTRTVIVRCVVSARLVPVSGEEVQVDAQSGSVDADGWSSQKVTGSPTVEWAWTVTAKKPRDQEVRLELRPAVAVDSASKAKSAPNLVLGTEVFVTEVDVTAPWWRKVAFTGEDVAASVVSVSSSTAVLWAAGAAAVTACVVLWRQLRPKTIPVESASTAKGTKKGGKKNSGKNGR